MAAVVPLKYVAFLSYSHKDRRAAERLHRAVETFAIDKDMVGRKTSVGPVPKTLRPVFRDREDFSGGHTLTEATVAALDASAALIVLCSPAAAASHYVNEEVRLFMRFRDMKGRYVMHCHNVVHEDHAMMVRWDIV